MNAYIWMDTVDKNQFNIGIKASSGQFVTWIPIFIDGISDIFGTDIYMAAKDLKPGVPTPIKLTLEFEAQP